MKNSSLRELSFYVFYNLITLVSITIIVSLITFFHFLLDHSFEAIESGIFDNGWGLIIISKLIALFVVMKIYVLNKNDRPSLKKLAFDHFTFPKREVFPILLSYWGMFLLMERTSFVTGVEYEKVIKSFVYAFIFYWSDLFLLAQISKKENKFSLKNFLYPLFFIITSKLSFLLITVSDEIGQITIFITFFNMMVLLFLSNTRGNKFSLSGPLIFLMAYICPMISFFGLDPVWGNTEAVRALDIASYFKNYIILSLLIMCYIYLKKIKYRKSYGIE
jgi:hypothetical protein